MNIQLAVLGTHRRRIVLEETIRELEERGRAWVLGRRTVFYAARDRDPNPDLPTGWRVVRWRGPNGGPSDHRTMIAHLDPTMDAILLEDDVQPCVNAVPAMVATEVPADCAWVSFYDWGGHYTQPEPGLYRHGYEKAFWGVQAIRVPARVLAKAWKWRTEFSHLSLTEGQDVWWGRIADCLNLKKAFLCPNLVQHVGRDSLFAAGGDLTGVRAQSTRFPGEEWDALADVPARIEQSGYARERTRITWCEFHGAHHPDPLICPDVT